MRAATATPLPESPVVPSSAGLRVARGPDSVERSRGSLECVFVFDLGLVAPLAVACARWLRRREAPGFVPAGMLLVKAAAMGLALLAMTWFARRAGQPAGTGLAAAWLAIAAGCGGLSTWLLRHCRA